jgi:hypothetical protein
MGNLAVRFCVVGLATLAGCPEVDLGDTPTDINLCNPEGGMDYFVTTIYPNYIKGDSPSDAKACTQNRGCHAEGDGQALSFKIQGNRDDTFNFKQAQQFIDCGDNSMSLLLLKPESGNTPHQGGDLFDPNSTEAMDFLGWFQ